MNNSCILNKMQKGRKLMKGISMKKHSNNLILILISIVIGQVLSVRRCEPLLGFEYMNYVSIEKPDTYKSKNQQFGHSSLQITASFVTQNLIQLTKSVGNFQKKTMHIIWTKVSELALERYFHFDGKQSFRPLSLRF